MSKPFVKTYTDSSNTDYITITVSPNGTVNITAESLNITGNANQS